MWTYPRLLPSFYMPTLQQKHLGVLASVFKVDDVILICISSYWTITSIWNQYQKACFLKEKSSMIFWNYNSSTRETKTYWPASLAYLVSSRPRSERNDSISKNIRWMRLIGLSFGMYMPHSTFIISKHVYI